MIEIQLNQGVQTFGMSITAGALSVNTVNYWVNRFAQYVGGPVENRAVSGSGLPDMAATANAFAPYGGRTKTGLIDGPLNDVRQAGAGCLVSVKPALDGMLSNLFSGTWRGAQWGAPLIVKTGVWSSLGASYGGRSTFWSGYAPMFTTDPDASISFVFNGEVVAIHGFASETDDWLDWDIEIDGVAFGNTEWAFAARPGTGKQSVAKIIDGLGSGSHMIKLTPPASGIPAGKRCVLDGFQVPLMAAPVLLGSIPNIANWSAFGAIGTWADAQSCNVIIEQVANEWAARGYPVEFVDLTEFIDPSRDFAGGDGVHPPDRGHLNWALGYLSSVRIKP